MRAIVIREAGGLDKLELTDVEPAVPGAGQVLLKVAACGVCYRDIVDRQGGYPFMRRPVITGHEVSGTIEALGPGVTGFAVGDRVVVTHQHACGECATCKAGDEKRCQTQKVYGLTIDGGYAERCVAYAGSLVHVPAQVPLEEASFLHCTAAVALRALRRFGRVAAGQTVLVTGATGGVGVHAVQVARLLGARVIAVTGSPQKRDALAALGVDEVIVAADRSWVHAVQKAGGVDVALELVGEPTFAASLRALKPGGQMVIVGNVTQSRVEVNPGYLIFNEVGVHGSAGATRSELRDVLAWAAEGKLRPIVADRLPLEKARDAQAKLVDRGVFGRQILVP